MPKYLIPVVWEMCGVMEVDAPTIDDANEMIYGSNVEPPDPENGEVIKGSLKVDYDCTYLEID